MAKWIQAHRRLLTSARILKAYYESKLQMDVELLTEAPVPQLDNDVSFTPKVYGFGLWGLRPSKPISVDVQREIAQMCDSVLGGLEDMEIQRDALERLQIQLERSLNGEMPSNVIALGRRPKLEDVSAKHRDRMYVLKLDCLIEGKRSDEIHRMAMELHSHGSRLAFVEYRDLDANQRQSISQLMALGPITLFVPDILSLTPFEQEMFHHLMQEDVIRRPLLMVGSTISYSELRQSAEMDEQFLTSLSRAYIKLTRPFSEYKEQSLIHYFLDSLSSSPT